MKLLVLIFSISLVSANPLQRRQGPPSLSLNLPPPFPSLVLVPRIPIPPILPQHAQVLDIVSQAVGQIGQVVNAPILVRPAGSPPILPSGITTTTLLSNVPIRPVQGVPSPASVPVAQGSRQLISVRPVAGTQTLTVRPVFTAPATKPGQTISVRPVVPGSVQVRPVAAQRGYYSSSA